MYPSSQLGKIDNFTEDDLPDELFVTVTIASVEYTALMSKITATPATDCTRYYEGQLSGSGPYDSEYIWISIQDADVVFSGIPWILELPTGWEFVGVSDSDNGSCLIDGDGNYTPGDDRVEDQFSDSYRVRLTPDIGGGWPVEVVEGDEYVFVIARASLCVWNVLQDGWTVVLTYNSQQEPFDKWELSWRFDGSATSNNDDGEKVPHQNTPVGDYTANISNSVSIEEI
jgi:uncharacterized protein YbdZ (MbtH family)